MCTKFGDSPSDLLCRQRVKETDRQTDPIVISILHTAGTANDLQKLYQRDIYSHLGHVKKSILHIIIQKLSALKYVRQSLKIFDN